MSNQKIPYVCGPLTELPSERREEIKKFYVEIAEICREVFGVRAFVPHEQYDPKVHSQFSPKEVDDFERQQVCVNTSVLIVVAEASSWGGGIEVEMAYRSQVPIVLLCEKARLENKKISRLLRGNPGITSTIIYDNLSQAKELLKVELSKNKNSFQT